MKLLTGVVASVALAHPAFAQEAGTDASTMTCVEFVALDNAGRTRAMASIEAAAVAAAAAIKEGTGVETSADDSMVGSDIAVDRDAEGSLADATATADAGSANAGATAATIPTAGGDKDMTAALLAACSSVPDMRVTDAMMQVETGERSGSEAGAAEGDVNGG